MPDGSSFPQIPTTVWWGVRALLNKTPRITMTDDLLGVELGVQPAAAKQYISELRRVGLLNDESRATELAHKWRMADTYADAVAEILATCYGDSLLAVAPDPSDRTKAIDWFQRQGLGEGSARNKAATYFLIASSEAGESPTRAAASGQPRAKSSKAKLSDGEKPKATSRESSTESVARQPDGGVFPVNLNLQIHISADASIDQIDAIFSSMRKHLGNARLS